jgi:hypothetical protein
MYLSFQNVYSSGKIILKFLQELYALRGIALYSVFFIGTAIPSLAALLTLCDLQKPVRLCAYLTPADQI